MTIYKTSDSSLSGYEREDKEVRRNSPTGRKPHRKKKHTTSRRSPRPDQRRTRIQEKDPDLKKGVEADPDLSLNYKHSSLRSFSRIAFRISIGAVPPEVMSQYFSSIPVLKDFLVILKGISEKLKNEYLIFLESKYGFSGFKQVYDDVNDEHGPPLMEIGDYPDSQREEIETINTGVLNEVKKGKLEQKKKYKITDFNNIKKLLNKISKDYESSTPIFKAGIRETIKSALEKEYDYPKPFIDFHIANPDSLEDLSQNLTNLENTGQISIPDVSDKQKLLAFLALASLHKSLEENPVNPDWTKMSAKIQELVNNVVNEFEYMESLNMLMKQYDANSKRLMADIEKDIEDDLDDDDVDVQLPENSGLFSFLQNWEKETDDVLEGFDEWIGEVKDFESELNDISKEISKNRPHFWTELSKAYLKYFEKNHPEKVPAILRLSTGSQSSNDKSILKMRKTAEYHGTKIQGNPDGVTNTGWKSIDKRYIGSIHHKSILDTARSMLKDGPWFEYSWRGGSVDAPVRAALDIAIATADESIYQSKIDAPTYEYLLNKLASWEYDLFSDTSLNMPKSPNKRKASNVSIYDEMVEFASFIK